MVGSVIHAIAVYTDREDWSMNEFTTIRFVGLDVPRDSIAIIVAQRDGRPAEAPATVPNDKAGLIRRLGSAR